MPIPPEEFLQQKIKAKALAHYAATRAPPLLLNLGAEIEKESALPADRGQRNLKQLILDMCGPVVKLTVISARRHALLSLPQTFGRMLRPR